MKCKHGVESTQCAFCTGIIKTTNYRHGQPHPHDLVSLFDGLAPEEDYDYEDEIVEQEISLA